MFTTIDASSRVQLIGVTLHLLKDTCLISYVENSSAGMVRCANMLVPTLASEKMKPKLAKASSTVFLKTYSLNHHLKGLLKKISLYIFFILQWFLYIFCVL